MPLEDAKQGLLQWMTLINRIAYETKLQKQLKKHLKFRYTNKSIKEWAGKQQLQVNQEIYIFKQQAKDLETRELLEKIDNFSYLHGKAYTWTKIAQAEELKTGDHIYIIITRPIVYEHHGIYIGNDKVIHLANLIVECNLNKFAHGLVVRKAVKYSYHGYPIPFTKTKIYKKF